MSEIACACSSCTSIPSAASSTSREIRGHRDGFLERCGIRQRDLAPYVAEARAPIAFSDAQRLGMRVAAKVEPGRILEAAALDDQLVAFPAPDRVTHETGTRVALQLAA